MRGGDGGDLDEAGDRGDRYTPTAGARIWDSVWELVCAYADGDRVGAVVAELARVASRADEEGGRLGDRGGSVSRIAFCPVAVVAVLHLDRRCDGTCDE